MNRFVALAIRSARGFKHFLSICMAIFGCAAILAYGMSSLASAQSAPPFHGTIFVNENILTEEDATTYVGLTDGGKAKRRMFDRRLNRFADFDAWIFHASFDDDLKIEVQANSEMDVDTARREAEYYLKVVGQLPHALRANVQTMWIHLGKQLFGGGNQNLLIHTEQGQEYARQGILEETLMHEAAHTSLDPVHARNDRWRKAQELDNHFISQYAKDNPDREDVAESYLLIFAVEFMPNRIPASLRDTVWQTIPNRIEYFRKLDLDMRPVVLHETQR
jgi:hypothetical protein